MYVFIKSDIMYIPIVFLPIVRIKLFSLKIICFLNML